ncbi:MAG: hypothetical protein LBT02_03950 [Rickettsiales bacterium]|jgi:hypothetical protein|nr:hypothetical protein [Rickettsiales bacterium]
MIYGDNNKKKKENKFVIERFTKHAQNDFNMNLHIKSIVDPRKIFKMLNAHIGIYKNLKNGITPDKTRETMFFLKRSKPHLDLIRINHYRNKT